MVFRRGEQPQPLADAPSRIVSWLDGSTVLVATDGCGGPQTWSRSRWAAGRGATRLGDRDRRGPDALRLRRRSAGIEEAVGGGVGMNAMAASQPPEAKDQPDGRRERSNQACVR
jgi:hypothetical protein